VYAVLSYYICVFILLFMCPHTTLCVSSYYYICPDTPICVLILNCSCCFFLVFFFQKAMGERKLLSCQRRQGHGPGGVVIQEPGGVFRFSVGRSLRLHRSCATRHTPHVLCHFICHASCHMRSTFTLSISIHGRTLASFLPLALHEHARSSRCLFSFIMVSTDADVQREVPRESLLASPLSFQGLQGPGRAPS
jgi:hypothetical protein